MNKLSSTLLLIACAYAFVTVTSAEGARDFDDSVFDVFTEEEGLVQTPASDLRKANAKAAAAHKAEIKKTKKLHAKAVRSNVAAKAKSIAHAAGNSLKNRLHAHFQGRLVKHFTRIAKSQAKKNAALRRKQRQAKNSAVRANSRNHNNMVKDQAKLVKTMSRVAASQKKMLARKARVAKFFANQIKAVKRNGKKARRGTMRRMRKYRGEMRRIGNKIKYNKRLAKKIQRNWNRSKAKSARKSAAIKAKYAKRVARLARINKANKNKFNAAVARGQAHFARQAKNNAMKAALATARIKLNAHINKMAERSTKRRAAKLHRRESRLKASAKRKELGAKRAAAKKLSESRQKEKIHKQKVSNEADTKYKRRAAHAAAMKKKADAAKAKAAAAVAAAEKSTKAQKKADAAQATLDTNIKDCGADHCLLGAKCIKTGKASGWYLDQVEFVKCTKKAPVNMMGDWAGTPFKEADFPEAHYVEPKFTMPVMPGFTWKISNHFDKVQAAQKAAIKKARL